jgi:hypothetical protein
MITFFKNFIAKILKHMFEEETEKMLVLKAKKLSIAHNNFKKINDLSEVEFQVSSQWGEDGIIDWLFNKFKKLPKIFVEIGTQDYRESNTRFLLRNKNFDGYLIEGDSKATKNIKRQRIYWKHNLTVKNKFVDKDNINKIVSDMKIPEKIGLLSLDIDGVDYWVLKALKSLDASIVICEYNSLFGSKKSVTVPYDQNFDRTKKHFSNLYYGASINAFIDLMKSRNYFLLGTNTSGNNAFFMKSIFSKDINKILKEKKIYMSKYRESRDKKGQLTYLDKKKSLQIIGNNIVVDLKDNKKKKIKDLNL